MEDFRNETHEYKHKDTPHFLTFHLWIWTDNYDVLNGLKFLLEEGCLTSGFLSFYSQCQVLTAACFFTPPLPPLLNLTQTRCYAYTHRLTHTHADYASKK